MSITLTPASHSLFAKFWDDAPNWGGEPLVNGNVKVGKSERGNLSDLLQKELVESFDDGEGCTWLQFTKIGIQYAADHNL